MDNRSEKIIDITVNSKDALKNILYFREENERLSQSTKEAKEKIKETEKAIEDSGKATEAQTKAIRELKAQIEQDTASRKLNNKAILDNQKVLMAQVKENQATEGSIREMRLEVSKLTAEWENMSGEMRAGEAGEALRSELASLNVQINSASLSVNNFKDNIGNYSSAIGGALNNNTLITNSLKSMGIQVDSTAVGVGKNLVKGLKEAGIATKAQTVLQGLYSKAVGTTTGALKVLKLAMIAVGIGAFVVLIGSLISALSKAKEKTDDFKSAMDSATFSTAEARDEYDSHKKKLEDLRTEYALLTGQMSEYEAQLGKANRTHLEELERIVRETNEALKKHEDGFWGSFWGSKKRAKKRQAIMDDANKQMDLIDDIYTAEAKLIHQKEKEKNDEIAQKEKEKNDEIAQKEREAREKRHAEHIESVSKLYDKLSQIKYEKDTLDIIDSEVFTDDDEQFISDLHARLDIENEARNQWREMQATNEFEYLKMQLDNEYSERIANAEAVGADTTDIMAMWLNEQEQLAHASTMAQLAGVATVAGSISSIISDVASKSQAGAVFAKALGGAQILASQGVAVAEGIKSAIGIPFPMNIPALATVAGAVASGVSQAKKLLSSSKVPKPPAILSAKATGVSTPSISAGVQAPIIRELGVIENRSKLDNAIINQEPPVVLVKDIIDVTEKVKVKESNAGY